MVQEDKKKVVGCCEDGDEHSVSIKCGEFLHLPRNCQLLKKDRAPRIQFVSQSVSQLLATMICYFAQVCSSVQLGPTATSPHNVSTMTAFQNRQLREVLDVIPDIHSSSRSTDKLRYQTGRFQPPTQTTHSPTHNTQTHFHGLQTHSVTLPHHFPVCNTPVIATQQLCWCLAYLVVKLSSVSFYSTAENIAAVSCYLAVRSLTWGHHWLITYLHVPKLFATFYELT